MSDRTPIPVVGIAVVGIVGGIGSGKSSVARWVATRHPEFLLINGDEVGHEVLTSSDVKDAIGKRFGNSVFNVAGEVDRRALGQVVFGSGDAQEAARRDLERIVHPRIRETFEREIVAAAAANKRVVLLDAAVLFEAGWNDLCHAVAFVDVPRPERLARLRAGRGWDAQEVERRESSQLPLESKRDRCQFVIDNAQSIDEAGRQLEQRLVEERLAQIQLPHVQVGQIDSSQIHAQAPSDPSRS